MCHKVTHKSFIDSSPLFQKMKQTSPFLLTFSYLSGNMKLASREANFISRRELIENKSERATNAIQTNSTAVSRLSSCFKQNNYFYRKTFLTAEAALMWILFTKKPSTYQEFAQLCREYGLTMASVRFEEAWAMAKWLERDGQYYISPESKF